MLDLKALDLAHIWHPCTQMKDHETLPLIPIQSAKGVYLYDFDGKSFIDGISSWWVNLFGHCNPIINTAIVQQLEQLEHIILAGFSHEGIITYSKRLCALLPQSLQKCFYADNGSSAVEVALKMSFHSHYNAGNKEKNAFLSLANAYHGETLGALSVGDVGLYKSAYKPLLLEALNTPVPSGMWNPNDNTINGDYHREIEALEQILKKHAHRICAFILEPLLQCAGGMNMYPSAYVQEACVLAQKYNIHIIFDEIAVGFGRTGSMFALEQCDVVPDFLCLSKGITGGYLPLSVVVTSDSIYQGFYAPYEEQKGFLHSHSYTGNALAIAAANAVLNIFEQDNTLLSNRSLSAAIAKQWSMLSKHKKVSNVRVCGMVFAFDLIGCRLARAGLYVYEQALEKGVLLRPLGNTIYFMPPYIISLELAEYVCGVLDNILENEF
ncbi:adenosylmethionine--8-amino-7-oxononanoate transaminase [Helicobacter labetoulli]|uniref:adenosylmethionine--8-amino-7-oxononanoate transaminase n=1 Tax=Helicobacter labetoulli TaxID=2315333 RepID=UPI000EF66F5D|nr:adenosylmethionine--8-amino-7-oxononanoate transaminase [Helicobacter labetoulli]